MTEDKGLCNYYCSISFVYHSAAIVYFSHTIHALEPVSLIREYIAKLGESVPDL